MKSISLEALENKRNEAQILLKELFKVDTIVLNEYAYIEHLESEKKCYIEINLINELINLCK